MTWVSVVNVPVGVFTLQTCVAGWVTMVNA